MEPASVLQDFVNAVIVIDIATIADTPDFVRVRDMVLNLAPNVEKAQEFVDGAQSYSDHQIKVRTPKAIKGESELRDYVAEWVDCELVKVGETISHAKQLTVALLRASYRIGPLYAMIVEHGLRR